MVSSPSCVRAPEGHGCAARFIRTPKAKLLGLRGFGTLAELVEVPGEFRRACNERGLIGRQGHRPPSPVRLEFVSGKSKAA
jgi:putative transposase